MVSATSAVGLDVPHEYITVSAWCCDDSPHVCRCVETYAEIENPDYARIFTGRDILDVYQEFVSHKRDTEPTLEWNEDVVTLIFDSDYHAC